MLTEISRKSAWRIQLEGVIQGVGFRPFVYKLAYQFQLMGVVYNSGQGVVIEVEGCEHQLEGFFTWLINHPPALASITNHSIVQIQPLGRDSFQIADSRGGEGKKVLIPPDVALCADCRREMQDPQDRHFRYPFTNCTNCGPRFTIVRDLPYDRAKTSMAIFPMCDACAAEYHHPLDRRFHAQPVACPDCGPSMSVVVMQEQNPELDRFRPDPVLQERQNLAECGQTSKSEHWVKLFKQLIKQGKIIAVKSLGGFHLTCDAYNAQAISELRRRKRRPAKPLAVMARDISVVKRYCEVSPAEDQLLQGPAAPIVILERIKEQETDQDGPNGLYRQLPELLAPGVQTLGVMLPYTPLHMLLFDEQVDLLVMTSGNAPGLPLAKDNTEALEELKDIAEAFFLHNRPIINRCDDSLVRVIANEHQFFRRSRGYVPRYVAVPQYANVSSNGYVPDAHLETAVLGLGSEMKNTFCLLKAERAFLSQHIGEMGSLENTENYLTSLQNFQSLTDISPQICGYDLHPGYMVSRLIEQMPYQAIPVQHHHAHLAACMAENQLDEKVIGLILDGTGYGLDGNIWGFEILAGDYLAFERIMHLKYTPLPGGDSAVRHPWRTALAYLEQAFDQDCASVFQELFPEYLAESVLILNMLKQRVNTPLASSCGRLFDAAAALTGTCRLNTYDGQAAIELGDLAAQYMKNTTVPAPDRYSFVIAEGIIDPALLIKGIVRDVRQGLDKPIIAAKFQQTVVEILTSAAETAREQTGLNKVVLSGGSWQNRLLFTQTKKYLTDRNFDVYYHTLVPPNDGGLALGQAMIAGRRWSAGVLSYTRQSG